MKFISSLPLAAALTLGVFFVPPAAAQFSTPVRNVENPARFAIDDGCQIFWDLNDSVGKTCNVGLGPVGKVVVLTTVTYSCSSESNTVRFLSAGILSSIVNGGATRAYLPTTQPLIAGSHVEQASGLTGLSIVIPSNSPQVQSTVGLVMGKTGTGVASCIAFFHGYYLP